MYPLEIFLFTFNAIHIIGNSASICLTPMLIITLSLVREIELFFFLVLHAINLLQSSYKPPTPTPQKNVYVYVTVKILNIEVKHLNCMLDCGISHQKLPAAIANLVHPPHPLSLTSFGYLTTVLYNICYQYNTNPWYLINDVIINPYSGLFRYLSVHTKRYR